MNHISVRRRKLFARFWICLALMLGIGFGPVPLPAEAHWLNKILREAGDAGGGAAKHAGHGLDNLGGISRHLKSLPHDADSVALGAHVTPEGHWKFTNAEGDVFTAATADEMARVVKSLAPDHAGSGNLKLYLSEDTVFAKPGSIKDLPKEAELHLLVGPRSYRLLPDPANASRFGYLAEIKPGLQLRLNSRHLFDEAIWHLAKPLSRSSIRVVALEPGAAQTLSAVPRFDAQSKAALIDKIDPWKLSATLPSIRGQTLVVTGRIEGEFLYFRPTSGGEKSILIADLKQAAKDSDVNLVMLKAADPLQLGGRNWFWQKVEVKGLDEALKRADFADFLDAFGQHRQNMVIEARQSIDGRIGFDVSPSGGGGGAASNSITDTMATWGESIFSQAIGNVITSGINADLADKNRQSELELRIVPGIPSIVQFIYLAGFILGLVGLGYVRWAWNWLWPPEARSEYASSMGYHAARGVRFVLFVLVFLPIVGVPAGIWAMLKGLFDQVWLVMFMPFRILRWFWRRIAPARGT